MVVAAAVAVVATTGCGAGEPQPSDEAGEHNEFVMEYAIEEAERVGAAPEQIALLEQAEREGEVSFEIYNEAVDNAMRCLREAGVEPYDGGIREGYGFPERFYSVPVEAEAADPVEFHPGMTVHRCIAEHSLSVEGAYQNQSSSVEAQEAHFRAAYEPHREEIVACAQREGIDVDPDAEIMEIVGATQDAHARGQTDVYCTDGMG